MPPEPPAFRSGNTLTTTFTGTRTERHGMPVERIPTPDRLLAWLDLQGLSVVSCSEEELRHAQDLREAIHAAATAAARHRRIAAQRDDVPHARRPIFLGDPVQLVGGHLRGDRRTRSP